MPLQTPEEIDQFLVLQTKTEDDLKTLCEGMGLPPIGTKRQLIKSILSLGIQSQTDTLSPQLIALRTQYLQRDIPGANEFLQRARTLIFNGKDNWSKFSVLNGKNESYFLRMRYAKCSSKTLQYIFTHNLIYPHQSQKELVSKLKENQEKYEVCLVNRQYGKKSFIMLHCKAKEQEKR